MISERNPEASLVTETHVTIVGVGLIGGSIAAAVRHRAPQCRITGIGRSQQRLEKAAAAGLLDDFRTQMAGITDLDDGLFIVCLPVMQIAGAVRQIAESAAPGSLITDAGSVKSVIYRQLHDHPSALSKFVGSHPIAGSEQTGFEFARQDLFVDRMCVVTPERSSDADVRRVCDFWQMLGSRIQMMTAEEHDRTLARTSHLPHVLSAAAARCVTEEMLPFAGTGFRDTTRIAAGSPELWSDILFGNRAQMMDAIRSAEGLLAQMRQALQAEDRLTLEGILKAASELRHKLDGDEADTAGS